MADFTDDDDALLAELGVEVEAKRVGSRTPQQERVIAGFEDIQQFVKSTGMPHGMAKATTFSNGFMRFGWTGLHSCPSAVTLLALSTTKAC